MSKSDDDEGDGGFGSEEEEEEEGGGWSQKSPLPSNIPAAEICLREEEDSRGLYPRNPTASHPCRCVPHRYAAP